MSEGPAKRQKLVSLFVELPRLVLDLIMRHLPGKDALALSHVNGKLLKVGSMDRLWKYLVERDFGLVVEKNCKVVYWEEWRFVDDNQRGVLPMLVDNLHHPLQKQVGMRLLGIRCTYTPLTDKNLDLIMLTCATWVNHRPCRNIYVKCCIRRGVDINPKYLNYWKCAVIFKDYDFIRLLLSFDHDQSGWKFDSLVECVKTVGDVELLIIVQSHINNKNRHLKNYPV